MGAGKFVEAVELAFSIVAEPKQSFSELKNKTFEKTVGFYARTLIVMALIAFVLNFLFWTLRSVYYDIFFNVAIDYVRLVNYTLGTSSAILFFYLYAGTFLLFIVSLVLKLFIRKLKYTEFLKVLMYSMSPLLLFGWVPPTPVPFLVWSVFLLFVGLKTYKAAKVEKESIKNRD